jgi:hypothetical protein
MLNLSLKSSDYHYASKHQARGELWLFNCLIEGGYSTYQHTDDINAVSEPDGDL